MDTELGAILGKLLAVANNGPEEVGLSAASTDRGNPALALSVQVPPIPYDKDRKQADLPDVSIEEVHESISTGPVCPLNEREAKLLWMAAQICCITQRAYGIYYEAGTNITTSPDEKTHSRDTNKLDGIEDVTHDHLKRALTLVAVGKVCWWMTNHHTGQGELLRYMQKALMLVFGLKNTTEVTTEHISFAHAIGHWYSTGAVLSALGIEGIHECHSAADTFELLHTRDMKLRIDSGPAGTGATTSYAAIVKKAMRSAFSVFLPASTGYLQALTFIDDDNHVDVIYHVGRGFLEHSNKACDVSHDLDEEAKISLSSFVHAIMPGSTLAKSKSIMTNEEVSGTDLYVKLVNAKLSLAVSTNDEESAALVRAMSSANASDDPLGDVRQANSLAPRNVSEALVAVRTRLASRKKRAIKPKET